MKISYCSYYASTIDTNKPMKHSRLSAEIQRYHENYINVKIILVMISDMTIQITACNISSPV